MQRSIFAITHLESKSTSRRRDDLPSRRFKEISSSVNISYYFDRKNFEEASSLEMDENEEGEMVEEESRRKLQLGWLYTHCMRKCRVQFLKFRRIAFSCHSNAIALVLPCPPPPLSSSFERPFFRFALFEACLCLVSTGVHREQTSTVWRDMELTRCFENFTSRYQTSQFWQKPSNTDGFQFRFGLSLSNREFVSKFINN